MFAYILYIMNKSSRKSVIADVIKSQKIHTQEDLQNILKAKGFSVTQATLSRDINELGASKATDPVEGQYYVLPVAASPHSGINVDTIDISGQLCVLHSKPGFASAIASVVDHTRIEGVMGTVAGDDTVLILLKENADKKLISSTLKTLFNISDVIVRPATPRDTKYAKEISNEIYISSLERKTGIARRTPEYINEKILAGKAVIATTDSGEFAGFSYIESWGGKSFAATSGLIVAHKFRGQGIAMRIKEQTFSLARTLFPDSKIFSITTGSAVMKMNYQLGFRPVTFSELTDDPDFWKGCEGCRHFDILKSHDYKMCICTGLLYDPKEK